MLYQTFCSKISKNAKSCKPSTPANQIELKRLKKALFITKASYFYQKAAYF